MLGLMMNAVDIASDDFAHAAAPLLRAAAFALSGLVCHTPEPTPPVDDDEDDEEENDRGSSGGNIDPDDDEGDFDDDDDDEDETLWTGRRGMFVVPAQAGIQVA